MRGWVLILVLAGVLFSCSGGGDDEEPQTPLPKNLVVTTQIVGADSQNPYGDGSGEVEFKASAENAVSYKLVHDGREYAMPGGILTLTFEGPGVNAYPLEVLALNASGASIKKSLSVEVSREYEVPADLMELLTGNDKKEWRIKMESEGHMGVGPSSSSWPEWWSAPPYEKDFTSMYDDRFVLSADQGFAHHTESFVYGKADPLSDDFGTIADAPNEDDEYEYYPLDDYAGSWGYSEANGRQRIHLSDEGFFCFYVGGDHVYEILQKRENELVLKTVGADANSWFFTITTAQEVDISDPVYSNLVWEDDFDIAGVPDGDNWDYDIGTGDNGWGNNEAQYYTNREQNVKVDNGRLQITAKAENYMGAAYTSARLKTQGKFDFTYGKVEVRAKLAGGGGTWPAIWMLGSNFTDVGWPQCGEIDVMEYVGNTPGKVQSALHNLSSSGDTRFKRSREILGESTEFHIYGIVWSEMQISFYLDGERYYIYRPETRNANNWPYDKDQFLILNVAMGGNLGGTIDPTFTESTMEIDYVRVYQ